MIKLKNLIKEELLTEAKKHGFDLTDFKTGGFQKVLKGLGIRVKPGEEGGRTSGWEWKGNGIMIVTGNDPITGQYHSVSALKRKTEKNYASYIGIEGKPDMVEKAVELIKKHAIYIKGESPGKRNFI